MTEAVDDRPKVQEEVEDPTTTTTTTTTGADVVVEPSSGPLVAIIPNDDNDDDIEPLDIFSTTASSSSSAPFGGRHEEKEQEELVAALHHLGLYHPYQYPPEEQVEEETRNRQSEEEEEEAALFSLPDFEFLDTSHLEEALFLCSSPFASDNDDDDDDRIDDIFIGSTDATTATDEDPRQRGQDDDDDSSLHQLQQQLHDLNLKTTKEQLQRQEEELLLQQLILNWNIQEEEEIQPKKTLKPQTPTTTTIESDETDCLCSPCNLEDAEGLTNSQDDEDEQERRFWQEQLAILQNNNENINWLLQSLEENHYNPNQFSDTDPFASLLLDLHTEDNDQRVMNEEQTIMQQEQEEHQNLLEEQPQQQQHGSTRPLALNAARPYIKAFGSTICQSSPSSSSSSTTDNKSQRECYGHRERILGCDFSPCGSYLATASQDSTVRIWECRNAQKLVATLEMPSQRFECLRVAWASERWASEQIERPTPNTQSSSSSYRYLLATGGADGVVGIWGSANAQQWTNYAIIDHAIFHRKQVSLSGANGAPKEDKESQRLDKEDNDVDDDRQDDDDDKPQIYSLQFIDHWKALPNRLVEEGADDKSTNLSNSFLLTSSDDHLHLWELDEDKLHKKSKGMDGNVSKQLDMREVLSLRFGPLHSPGYGVTIDPVTSNSIFHFRNSAAQPPTLMQQNNAIHANDNHNNNAPPFGGDRNPDNLIFIFDASYCAANGLLGVALSDGSLRLINGRGVCLKVLQLPGCQSHLTSFCWDSKGERLATTVATGHVITWGIFRPDMATDHQYDPDDPGDRHMLPGSEEIKTTCCAVMEGGHKPRRPLFGAHYLENDELLISWGSDGRLCLWDSRSQDEEIDFPLSILLDNHGNSGTDYPIYAVSITRKMNTTKGESGEDDDHNQMLMIAIAGGGTDGGFLGIPVYLQDVGNLPDDDEIERKDVKKIKTAD
jgi:WD40 repeat protein